jgi:ubiquinol-cytochrome c reductase cytochrome c1 subunit
MMREDDISVKHVISAKIGISFFFLFFSILFLFIPLKVFAEEMTIALEKAPINTSDLVSIKRGAKVFSTICISCHTLVYLKYDKLTTDAGITYARMPVNIKQWPFGVKPPDLSLEANYRGVDWIYTYLHSFYVDPTRPTGFNNVLVPNTAMTAILSPLQGRQMKVKDVALSNGKYNHRYQWYDVLVLQQQGSMTPAQYDATVADVVNFLNYAANPYEFTQRKIGIWVMGFFMIMIILMVMLKHEYWSDVKNAKKD